VDALLVIGLSAFGIAWGLGAHESGGPLQLVLGVVGPLLAVIATGRRRRRDPLPVVIALAIAAGVISLASGAYAWSVLGLAGVFMVTAYEPRARVRGWVLAIVVATLIVLHALTSADWVGLALNIVLLAAVIGWAWGTRTSRLYQESLRQRAEEAERERDLRAAQAVAQERARIARDIHDIVSHSLAVVAVQASGAQRIADRDPQRAKEALGVIADTARGALTEMRALLQVLRTPDGESAGSAPAPGLVEINAMVADLVARGVPVRQQVTGSPFRMGTGAELAVHRVVQEALTNAVKHGDVSQPVLLQMDYEQGELQVSVVNQLPDDPADGPRIPGSGLGLAGMAERLALYGGSLQAGPIGTEFQVRASIPRPEHAMGEPQHSQ
jgi:signal transduction histidine kinase